MITADMFYRLRFHRGLKVSPSGEFSDPRLKEIAAEQAALFDRLEGLDNEVAELKEKEDHDKLTTGV